MPSKFDTKRIYELPIMKHNIGAIKLIYNTVFGEELSDTFLQKAVEHNKLLSKLIIVDNIAVGCIYGHVEQKENAANKNNKTLVIDFICILKPYQKHGVGSFVLNKMMEETKKELGLHSVCINMKEDCEAKEFFVKCGFVENGESEYTFDKKTMKGIVMTKEM